jgi:cytochrome bd-type quinol oxidase subunit 2
MNKIKRIIISIAAAVGLIAPMAVPVMVSAEDTQVNKNLNCGANLDFGTDCQGTGNEEAGADINNLVTRVINIISLVVGVIAVIMIIVGGLKYITSQGESAGVTSAKNTIMYAIVGLIVVALAQVIVRFVVNRATPTDTTT